MTSTPASFDPLEYRPESTEETAAHARNIVKNVLDSYTGRFDVLAEAVQNALDAVEARWGAGLDAASGRQTGEYPTIRVELDASPSGNEITITDNGTGIRRENLREVFTPHLSPKLLSKKATRGHKGVGTTFLIYGHPKFEVHTKTAEGDFSSYLMLGGSTWVQSDELLAPPKFEPCAPEPDRLGGFGSGTSITVKVDEGTRFGRLRGAQYNKLETWELVLRTYTAIGVVSVGVPDHRQPEWLRELRVELALSGVSSEGTRSITPKFRFPHEDADTKLSISELLSPANEGSRYDMLYLELGRDELEKALQSQIQELENSNVAEDQEILQTLRRYETSVYASWAYKNTLYEDLYRSALGEPSAKRFQYMNVRGGLLVSSVGMPVGETTDHPYSTMKPEYRRRLFMIAAFNEKYSPDLGRKTIPAQDRPFLEWLERQVQNLFLKHIGKLVRSNEDAPHQSSGFAQAKEELAQEAETIRKRVVKLETLSGPLAFGYAPRYEAELVGIFYSLLATGDLSGYSLLSVPGSRTRLDGYFDFTTSDFGKPTDDAPVPLGVAASKARDGVFHRKGKWLEFKVRLDELVEDFDAEDASGGKKYYDFVDLAVVWEVPKAETIGDYDLSQVGAGNWNEREYYGVTHLLRKSGSNHVLQVIAIQDLLRHPKIAL